MVPKIKKSNCFIRHIIEPLKQLVTSYETLIKWCSSIIFVNVIFIIKKWYLIVIVGFF